MIKSAIVLVLFGAVLGLPTNSSNSDVSPRIVGGEETDITRNPWQLALLYYAQHFCGAVEIHPKWALTTAHCLIGVIVDNLSIRAGSTTRSTGGQVIDVVRFYENPHFNNVTLDLDFALLELDEPITIQTASPIALPGPHFLIHPGETAIITGWGTTSTEGLPSESLRLVKVPVVGHIECQGGHPNKMISGTMFCAGDMEEGGRDACRGDAGGPVIIDGVLAGLVSWGAGCGLPNTPGVHARVSAALHWIYETSGI